MRTDQRQYCAALLTDAVLHDLAVEAESALFLASAIETLATETGSNVGPQKLREAAALLKCVALQLGLAAANIVGTAERLRLVSELDADVDAGKLLC